MYCYFPRRYKNPRYRNADLPPGTPKPYNYYITVGCGVCPQCLKRKGNDWKVRLFHEVKSTLAQREYDSDGYITKGHCEFITLTFSDDCYELYVDNPNVALRKFLERYRKKFGVSLRHWFITELGSERGRLHFHGIVFDSKFNVKKHTFDRIQNPYTKKWQFTSNDGLIAQYNEELKKLWKYGGTFVGFADESSISYIVKYMTKRYNDDSEGTKQCFNDVYTQRVFASDGIGISFTEAPVSIFIKDDGKTLVRTLILNGWKYAMPRYYQLKIFGEDLLREASFQAFIDDPPPNLYFDGYTYPDERTLLMEIRERADRFIKRPLFPAKVLKRYSSELHSHSFTFEDFASVYDTFGRDYAQSWYNKFIKEFDNVNLKSQIYECYSIA